MRIDQPDPIDPGGPDAPGAPGDPDAPGVPRGVAAERRGATEAAADRAPHREPEAAPERTPHRETEAAPERAPRHESETAAERTSRREPEAAPERTPPRDTGAPPERIPPRDTGAPPDATARQDAKAPVSRAEQIAAHLRYRETVSVAVHAADGRAAWAEALPQLRAAWEEHKERYPEQTRAAPRTEPDGSWTSGEHRRLDPEQNTEATKAHADLADEAGRHILPALRRVESADPERQLAGLEHMVKGEDRLKEKMADFLRAPGVTVRQALEEVPDAVRFTFRYSAERYSEGVLIDVNRLKSEGFELIKLKNLWHTDQYKGVNSQWRIPETETRFEMQFHTPQSLDAKEITHEAYERIRSKMAAPTEERDLENFQRRVNGFVSTPPGTDQIKDYPEKTDG